MATVLEEYTTDQQRSVVFCGQGLNAEDIHKEMFPVYVGECLSRKVVHSWVEKFSEGPSKVEDDARTGVEVAETTAV
jgi:hypothetical protein